VHGDYTRVKRAAIITAGPIVPILPACRSIAEVHGRCGNDGRRTPRIS
jgi:hypothetical protein